MTHQDFLTAFAELNNIGTLADLLELHSQKYASQINSRENARKSIVSLEKILGLSWEGQRVLDWGCTYGACAIEIAKLGALSVGCDVSSKWLELAKINAKNEANAVFLNCDASLSSSQQLLAEFGAYNLVLADKILDHIYDSVGALKNIRTIMAPDGIFYFKLTNGRATRNILKEKYKQVFGLSILAPDYWPLFVKAPFLIYYRRWEHWLSLFNEIKFCDLKVFNNGNNESIDVTRKHILADMEKIRQYLKSTEFNNLAHSHLIRLACHYYLDELDDDLKNLSGDDLYIKYRAIYWEGTLKVPKNA